MRAAWTEDDIALLKTLWAAGATAEAIGRRLGGMSRSAVLGKVFRLRLPAAPGGNRTPAPATTGKPAAPARRRGLVEPPQPAEARPKSLFDLTNTCCRWPYRRPGAEKYFFCGAPEADLEAGVPYCPRHMKRAYLVPPPRIPQTFQRPGAKSGKARAA